MFLICYTSNMSKMAKILMLLMLCIEEIELLDEAFYTIGGNSKRKKYVIIIRTAISYIYQHE